MVTERIWFMSFIIILGISNCVIAHLYGEVRIQLGIQTQSIIAAGKARDEAIKQRDETAKSLADKYKKESDFLATKQFSPNLSCMDALNMVVDEMQSIDRPDNP